MAGRHCGSLPQNEKPRARHFFRVCGWENRRLHLEAEAPETTEGAGEAWGAALVYSGNFIAEVEVDSLATSRLRLGIHPDGFEWQLQPGATFCTPEAVFAWSPDGLDGLSDSLHRLFEGKSGAGVPVW